MLLSKADPLKLNDTMLCVRFTLTKKYDHDAHNTKVQNND